MTSVYLYGELRNKFGDEFNFKINSPKEAFLALNANRKGFLDELKKLAVQGIHYRIVVDDQVVENPKEIGITKSPKEIHLVPIVWGAGKNGGAFAMIAIGIGLAAFTAGASLGMFGATAEGLLGGGGILGSSALGTAVISIGAGIAIQGVMSLLFPQPKPDFNQEVQAGGKSYLFGGRQNNTAQGQAVPVGYGRLLVGSSQISNATTHYSLKTDMRALMTPTDEPIDDYTQLEFVDENVVGAFKYDSFYTNQSSAFDDSPSFSSVNILNSYINIMTKSAETVTSTISEAVVKTNAIVVSNPDLTTFDEDITFTWTDLTPETNNGNVKIENPYSFDPGLVYRIYRAADFDLYSQYNVGNTASSYFANYNANQLVSFGPSQFEKLNFQKWDENISYISGELIWYDTGDGNQTRYRSIATGTGHNPTGTSHASYWEQITAPATEEVYLCKADNTKGYLPTDTGQWTKQDVSAVASSGDFNTFVNNLGTPSKEDIYADKMDTVNPYTIDGSESLVANSVMEFLGYIYIDKVKDREIDAVDAVDGTMYEITKVGTTNWSSIGVAGTAALGTTFTKNSTTATGSGKVYPVVKYSFTMDCDDIGDLYIDGRRATFKYTAGGMAFPTNQAGIDALPASANSTVLKLTTGYHKIYCRMRNYLGASGVTLYYKYDSNWDTVYSSWAVVPASMIFHQKLYDIGIPKNTKFLSKIGTIVDYTGFVTGKKYVISTVGTMNWSSIGASSAQTGTVFIKNSTPASGTGFAFSDSYSFAEAKAASSNRLVRFVAQRPADINNVSSSTAVYQAAYQCKVEIGRVTLYSSPVKIYIKFLPIEANLEGVGTRTILPITTQQTA